LGKVWGRAESWRRARRAAAEESGRCASARRGRPTPPCSRCSSASPQLFSCIAFVFRPLVSSRSTRLSGSLPVPDDACPPVSCPPYVPSSARRRPLPSRGLHAAAVSSVVSFFPGSPKRVRAAASTTLVAVPRLPVLSGLGALVVGRIVSGELLLLLVRRLLYALFNLGVCAYRSLVL